MLPFSYAYEHIVNTMRYCVKMGIDAESCAHLHEEIEVATVIVIARRGVRAHNFLAVNLGRNGDMLASRKAEHIVRVRQFEPVAAGTHA